MNQRLWTPWRMRYIKSKSKHKGCVLCDISGSSSDQSNFVIYRSALSYIVLNIYPYANGHMMVCPHRHVADLSGLRKKEVSDLFCTVQLAEKIIHQALQPQGLNIGINLGAVAGAGLPGHVHVHLVPRWQGDANFMPVIAETKVIPQMVKDSYRVLLKARKTIVAS